ncbi:MAG: response regulator, partial [Candidatus Acidiferrum sp.]
MKPCILIVDDSLTVRMDLGEAFETAECAITLCSTLAEARKALSSESFDLVILDVLLPDGDGVE